MAEPWDRLSGESVESYRRFLIYRNCGIRRSLRRAYLSYLRTDDGYTGTAKGIRHLPPDWQRDARDHFWRSRASAWDIRNLHAYGARLAVLHTQAVTTIAEKSARWAARLNPGDDGWSDVLSAVRVVADFLTPDVVRGIQERNQPATPAAVAAAEPD